jgi:hypothetical protein
MTALFPAWLAPFQQVHLEGLLLLYDAGRVCRSVDIGGGFVRNRLLSCSFGLWVRLSPSHRASNGLYDPLCF